MSASKKYKIYGLSGLELDLALTQLRKIRASAIKEEMPESDPTPADTFLDQLDSMIVTLEWRVRNPLSLSFSFADDKTLERFKIVGKGLLILQPPNTLRKAIAASRIVGSDKLWTCDRMYSHLAYLGNLTKISNEASSRMVIDTFFFRATSMVHSPQKKMIMMLEKQVPVVRPMESQMDTISGVIEYTAIFAESDTAFNYIRLTSALKECSGKEMIAFFAVEAKASGATADLEQYFPQIIVELVACAKHLKKSNIRGVLTTGFKWHFIVVEINTDGEGAEYWVSEVVEWNFKLGSDSRERIIEVTDDESDPALIAGILSSWIPQSFAKFEHDEWFSRVVL